MLLWQLLLDRLYILYDKGKYQGNLHVLAATPLRLI
jgi:hypothetical protein